jgi:hypothetical protein
VLPPVNESAGASNSNTFAPERPGGYVRSEIWTLDR